MKRDMNLMRKILFKIEEEYQPGQNFIPNLEIVDYDKYTVAEHCDLLYQAGLITDYKAQHTMDSLISWFRVGNLSNYGYEYLEQIRNENVWEKVITYPSHNTSLRASFCETVSYSFAGDCFGDKAASQ